VLGFGVWQTLRLHASLGLLPTEQLLASYCGTYGEVEVIKVLTSDPLQLLLNSKQRLSGTQHALASQHHQAWVPLLFCRNPE